MRLILKNKINNPQCHISVTEFPFLIGRKEPALVAIKGFEQKVTDAVSYLSRDHAIITFEDDILYITDHGSLNGTSVNDQAIDNKKIAIKHGDSLDFSGKLHFTIIDDSPTKQSSLPQDKTIIVDETEYDEMEPSDIPPPEPEDKTVYMTSATTFLDILTEDSILKKAHKEVDRDQQLKQNKHTGIKQLYLQWSKKILLIALPILALVFGAFLFYNRSPAVKLNKLYKNKQYTQAALLADNILAGKAKDEQTQIIFFNSIIRSTLAGFPEALEQGQFQEIEKILAKAKQLARHSEKLSEVIKLLQLTTDLQFYFKDKRSSTLVFNLNDKDAYDDMLKRWKDNKLDYSSYLDELRGHLASFTKVRNSTYKNLTLLQQSRSGKLQAVDILIKNMKTHLQHDQPELIQQEIINFRKKYPFISGISSYENDLSRYLQIWQAITSKDINKLIKVTPEANFQHVIFKDRLDQLKLSSLPADNILMDYLNAEDAWLKGDSALAASLLRPLTTEIWGEVAKERLAHYNEVYNQYQRVVLKKQQADYTESLISFFKILTPNDAYFRNIFQDDLVKIQENQLKTAAILLEKSQKSWEKYVNKGRIKGRIRLQNELSKDYRDQALLLTDAYMQTKKAQKIYQTYQLELPPKNKTIHSRIINEATNQVARMKNLERVLNQETYQAKINLLPKIISK